MPEICSCGAQLVEEARFCHRCGKPTFEAPAEEEEVGETEGEPARAIEASEVEPGIVSAALVADISFANGAAVRVGLLVAALAVLIFVPLAQAAGLSLFGVLLLTLASGLLAVFLYQRRTGVGLSLREGARLGWITGVFIFALFLVLFTISLIPAIESGDFAKIPDEALAGKLPAADLERVKEVLANPVLLSLSILFFMAIYFVGATVLTSLGGMLGAKFFRRDQRL